MPQGAVPWEIAGSSRAIIELLPSVIRLSTAQKNCQKRVNTRENASKRRSVSLYYEARAHPQSIVFSRSFPRRSLSLPEVSQTCSQVIHTRFVIVLASGLETRNPLRKRQEKNEFNFRLRQKNFLDWENEARVSARKQKQCVEKNSREPDRDDSESPRRTEFAADCLRIAS
jgi:hypothetical protein